MSALDKAFEHFTERLVGEIATLRADFSAGLAETRNAVRITGARNYPLVNGGGLVSTGRGGRLVGWSVRESSGSNPATVTVYDGRDTSGDVLATFTLPAGASSNAALPAPGVSYADGLFVATAGAVVGSVYFGAVD